jgi:hypothetical protein
MSTANTDGADMSPPSGASSRVGGGPAGLDVEQCAQIDRQSSMVDGFTPFSLLMRAVGPLGTR